MNKLFNNIGLILVAIGTLSSFTSILPIRSRIDLAIAAPAFKVKLPPPPPNRGIAGNRIGGASRIANQDPIDEGTKSDRHLTAFVPEYRNSTEPGKLKSQVTKVWGLTANKYPTLWFYIPYAQDSIDSINFILRDGDNPSNQAVYQDSIQPPTQPGIINFSLPQTNAPLAIDRLYQWELKLTMKRQLNREISVKGWIQRASLSSDLSDLMEQVPPNRKAAIYAENGFWYDALSTLAELRRNGSQDLTTVQDWRNLLQSVDLAKLANKPFVK